MKLGMMVMLSVCVVTSAHARDMRVSKIAYDPDKIVKIQGHYRYATVIEFADNEVVQGAVLGDSEAWEATPARNMLFLKPVLEQAATNMTVMTNKRAYLFELAARGGYAESPQNAVYRVKFTYPDDAKNRLDAVFVNADPNRAVSPDKLNFDYTYAGASSLKPKRVFDDGDFTYIQFEKGTDFPAIFMVNKQGKESLVNFAVKGLYMVIPTVSARYSLRNGEETLCLFNEPLFDKWESHKDD